MLITTLLKSINSALGRKTVTVIDIAPLEMDLFTLRVKAVGEAEQELQLTATQYFTVRPCIGDRLVLRGGSILEAQLIMGDLLSAIKLNSRNRGHFNPFGCFVITDPKMFVSDKKLMVGYPDDLLYLPLADHMQLPQGFKPGVNKGRYLMTPQLGKDNPWGICKLEGTVY